MIRSRTLFFLLLLAASLAILAGNDRDRRQTVRAANIPFSAAGADMTARIGMANVALPSGNAMPHLSPTAQKLLALALRRYRDALNSDKKALVLVRRIGILLSLTEGPDSAWHWFQTHPDPRYADLWHALYAPGSLSTVEQQAAQARLAALPDNWYRSLARWQLERKAGHPGLARAALQDARDRVRPSTVFAVLFSQLAFFGGLLGIFVWILILFQRHGGSSGNPHPFMALPGSALGEAFILWFFVLTAGGWGTRLLLQKLASGGLKLTLPLMLAIVLTTQLCAGLVGVWRLRAARQNAEAGGITEQRPALLQNIAWGVAAYLAAIPLLFLTAVVLGRLLPNVPSPPNPAATLALGARGPWQWLLLALIVVVVGPLFEETFFRGALFTALRQRTGAAASIAISAAAFALVHPQLPLGFFPILTLGAVFAYVVELRRSLVPSIVAHMLNNGIVLLFFSLLRTP